MIVEEGLKCREGHKCGTDYTRHVDGIVFTKGPHETACRTVNVKWVNGNIREQLTRQRLRHSESAANLQRNQKHASNKVRLSSGTYSGVATILVYGT